MSKNLIKAALFTPSPSGWGLPLALVGSPATVKSSLICAVAAEYELPIEVLSPGERGEGAFGVVPVPQQQGRNKTTVLTYPAPDWVSTVMPRGVVFVDELNTAPPAYQAALLGLMLERRIGGQYLGRSVRLISAFNPPESSRNVWELSPALANRLVHIAWQAPTLDEWSAWLMSADFSAAPVAAAPTTAMHAAEAEEQRVLRAWPAASAQAKALVTAFLRAQPHRLHVEPAADDPNSGRAWASRRSWTLAVCALAGAAVHALAVTERCALLAGCVSEAIATEFLAWEAANDLPDAAQVLDGAVAWKHDPLRTDKTLALLNGAAALVCGMAQGPQRDARIAVLWPLLAQVVADAAAHDLVIPALRMLLAAKIRPKDATASKTLAALSPALRAAGILGGV